MRITRIDLEGQNARFATLVRRRESRWIEITILTIDRPNGERVRVAADTEKDLLSAAERLNGSVGTHDDRDMIFKQLQQLR
jgi:hypothetical protein